MKVYIRIFIIIFLVISHIVSAQTDVLTDQRDGHEYRLIEIGSQAWTHKNSIYAPYVNRMFSDFHKQHFSHIYKRTRLDYDTVPEYNTPMIFQYHDDWLYANKYGYLYTWPAAQNACPVGSHLPSEKEFEQLLLTVGKGDDVKARQALVGKETSSGFDALLGGYLMAAANNSKHREFCSYIGYGRNTGFWTSTSTHKKRAKVCFITRKHIKIKGDWKGGGYYVRCVKD